MEDGKEREKGRKAPKKDLAGALELVETGGGGELQTHSVGSPAQRGAEGQQVPKRIELQAFASRQGDESDSSEREMCIRDSGTPGCCLSAQMPSLLEWGLLSIDCCEEVFA